MASKLSVSPKAERINLNLLPLVGLQTAPEQGFVDQSVSNKEEVKHKGVSELNDMSILGKFI